MRQSCSLRTSYTGVAGVSHSAGHIDAPASTSAPHVQGSHGCPMGSTAATGRLTSLQPVVGVVSAWEGRRKGSHAGVRRGTRVSGVRMYWHSNRTHEANPSLMCKNHIIKLTHNISKNKY